jgi:hypothetical protein
MNERKVFGLVHAEARRRAVAAVAEAPEGYRVTVEPPKRTLDQNSLLWPVLECFSAQLEWPVNGRMVKMTAEDWKDLLSAAYRRESQRVAMGVDGGMVMLGLRTSKMNKREFSEFLEFVFSVAADRGVVLERDEVAA